MSTTPSQVFHDTWPKLQHSLKDGWQSSRRLYRKMLRHLPGAKVSEIHLMEANERYYSLMGQLDEYLADQSAQISVEQIAIAKSCKANLERANSLRTRKQEDLNGLWRALTRVRIVILDKLVDDNALLHQLDFCREEARRLAVDRDPEINDMIQKLAEVSDPSGSNAAEIKRLVRALNERFNTVRTTRIYDQYIKIRTYKTALVALLFLSFLLVGQADVLVKDFDTSKQPPYLPPVVATEFTTLFEGISYWIGYQIHYIIEYTRYNVLAFVFLGGLVGGFFSVVIRVRDRQTTPGEDAYFRWYVLSKPFVGALGAVIVYILFQSGLISLEIVEVLGNAPAPKVFGFAFLSGFSERMVFPEFR